MIPDRYAGDGWLHTTHGVTPMNLFDDTIADTRRQIERELGRAAPGTKPALPFPIIVCLCGSTRFHAAFREATLRETLAGRIVLSIGCDIRSDAELFGDLSPDELASLKSRLDELHLRKIDLADEILVLNVGGYVGESTSREIAYAQAHGKRVRWMEEPRRDNLDLEDCMDAESTGPIRTPAGEAAPDVPPDAAVVAVQILRGLLAGGAELHRAAAQVLTSPEMPRRMADLRAAKEVYDRAAVAVQVARCGGEDSRGAGRC